VAEFVAESYDFLQMETLDYCLDYFCMAPFVDDSNSFFLCA